MVFLIHIAKSDGVGKELIQILRAGLTCTLGKPNGELYDGSVRLSFLLVLIRQGPHAFEHIAMFRSMVLHTYASSSESRVG